jgi:hypothetical protein
MNKFLSADPARLGRPDVPFASDAVDEELVGGTAEELKTDLIEMLDEDLVRHRVSDLVRYAWWWTRLRARPASKTTY